MTSSSIHIAAAIRRDPPATLLLHERLVRIHPPGKLGYRLNLPIKWVESAFVGAYWAGTGKTRASIGVSARHRIIWTRWTSVYGLRD